MLLDGQRFEEAVRAVSAHEHVSLDLPAAGSPVGETTPISPTDAAPTSAFDAQWRAGNLAAARRVLDDAAKDATAAARDPEIWRLRAALDALDAAWPSAWQNLERYLEATGKEVPRS